MKTKKIRIALAAVLLALTVSGADAYGQNDNFFSTWNEGGDSRTEENGTVNASGEASWGDGFQNAPVGGGLLILAASGMCYAGIKRFKKSKI
ncbi:MAG: hypothetical protein MJ000_01535 [Bacteroidales bacterium]|nr:hypothetical protein [Bacteroidales bacterium]